jgi:hypothetical protein
VKFAGFADLLFRARDEKVNRDKSFDAGAVRCSDISGFFAALFAGLCAGTLI